MLPIRMARGAKKESDAGDNINVKRAEVNALQWNVKES